MLQIWVTHGIPFHHTGSAQGKYRLCSERGLGVGEAG